MYLQKFLTLIAFGSLWTERAECVFPLIPAIPAAVALTGGIIAGYQKFVKCRLTECCDDNHIPANFTMLSHLLSERLYGQQLAHETVLYALRSHMTNDRPKKALAMSFHGMPGSGKNYMASFIVKSLYRKGEKSKYFRMYKGRIDFPSESRVQEYKEKLIRDIKSSLTACERFLFVFDEVDKMPEGVLNALVPFLDYHTYTVSEDMDPRKAIFIFLSNTGGNMIVRHLIKLWEQGKKREQTRLQDFESLMTIGAFNEKGGFHKSDTIEASLIDHYIPFLPLEENHVKGCLRDAFYARGVKEPSPKMMDEAMSYLTFGPAPHNIYANAGCKRIDQKVATIVQRELASKMLRD